METGAVQTASPLHDEKDLPPGKAGAEGKATDLNRVGWEKNDAENPRNWSVTYKCWITFQLGMLALAASLGSSITAPAQNAIAEYVGVSPGVAVLSISLYM